MKSFMNSHTHTWEVTNCIFFIFCHLSISYATYLKLCKETFFLPNSYSSITWNLFLSNFIPLHLGHVPSKHAFWSNLKPSSLVHKMLWIKSLYDNDGNLTEHSYKRVWCKTQYIYIYICVSVCDNNNHTQCDIYNNMCYELHLFEHTKACIYGKIIGPS